MRISSILYFSPKYKYIDLNFEEKDKMINCFEDRVREFYINPAKKLLSLDDEKFAFAVGVICVTTIDFLSLYHTGLTRNVGKRITRWLQENLEEFQDEDIARDFYLKFRNGLVHEGRIKDGNQFSFIISKVIEKDGDIMIINPKLLLKKIEDVFNLFIDKLRKDDELFEMFRGIFKKQFEKDVEIARGIRS